MDKVTDNSPDVESTESTEGHSQLLGLILAIRLQRRLQLELKMLVEAVEHLVGPVKVLLRYMQPLNGLPRS